MLTGTDIIKAVCSKLSQSFPDVPIHRERMEQDFIEPCFFVWIARTDTEPVIWPRFEQRHNVEVRYYPENDLTQNADALDIAGRLIESLHHINIEINGAEIPVWAIDYTHNIVDDALHMSIRYRTEGFFGEPHAPIIDQMDAEILTK